VDSYGLGPLKTQLRRSAFICGLEYSHKRCQYLFPWMQQSGLRGIRVGSPFCAINTDNFGRKGRQIRELCFNNQKRFALFGVLCGQGRSDKIRTPCVALRPLWFKNARQNLQLHQFFLFLDRWFEVTAFVVIEDGLDDFFRLIDEFQ